jgi:hypothetical protein
MGLKRRKLREANLSVSPFSLTSLKDLKRAINPDKKKFKRLEQLKAFSRPTGLEQDMVDDQVDPVIAERGAGAVKTAHDFVPEVADADFYLRECLAFRSPDECFEVAWIVAFAFGGHHRKNGVNTKVHVRFF